MFLLYKPEGSDEVTRYEFRPARIRSGQASELLRHYKRLTGNPQVTWEGFKSTACPAGDPEAKRLMLWYCQRLQHAKLKLDDVDPFDDEVEVELDLAELTALRDRIAATKGLPAGQQEMMLDRFDAEIAAMLAPEDAPIVDDGEVEAPGKADEVEADTPTTPTS